MAGTIKHVEYRVAIGGKTRMPLNSHLSFETVRTLAHQLPDVEDSTIHGAPSLKVRGKLLACIAVHKSARPGSLAVRIDMERREALLHDAPDTYYVTDHYRDYPTVLVDLSKIEKDALRDLLSAAWTFVTKRQRVTRK